MKHVKQLSVVYLGQEEIFQNFGDGQIIGIEINALHGSRKVHALWTSKYSMCHYRVKKKKKLLQQ